MSKKQESKEVATVNTGLPAEVSDLFMQDAGAGSDDIGSDIAIPFISILQAMSPQVKRGDRRIEGAEEGDIYNNVTQKVVKADEGIRVIPCAYRKAWVEWVPKDAGGGFVGEHGQDIEDECTRVEGKPNLYLANGNEIKPTAYHYVLILDNDGGYELAVIGMTSTNLKKSRKWNSMVKGLLMTGASGKKFNPPMYSQVYTLKPVLEQKDQYSWFTWSIAHEGSVPSADLFHAAKAFREDITGNKVSVVQDEVAAEDVSDSDVPF